MSREINNDDFKCHYVKPKGKYEMHPDAFNIHGITETIINENGLQLKTILNYTKIIGKSHQYIININSKN